MNNNVVAIRDSDNKRLFDTHIEKGKIKSIVVKDSRGTMTVKWDDLIRQITEALKKAS